MDYADRHWYASLTAQGGGELVSDVWTDERGQRASVPETFQRA